MKNNPAADHFLTNDVDCSDTVNWNGGAGFEPVGTNKDNPFVGSFDGKRYKITGLYINRPDTDYVGLFGWSDVTGVIKNVCLENVNINGKYYVGGLVGYNYGSSISNSYSTGSVKGYFNVGGLVGHNRIGWTTGGGSISSSYSTASVSGTSSSVGGLVGNNMALISDSYSTANVIQGSNEVGGLVGRNQDWGEISNSYSTGIVSGDTYIGGLVGSKEVALFTPSIVSNSYWNRDVQTSGKTMNSIGTAKTTAEMKQQSTFAGWNFVNTWTITEGVTYPLLKWQVSPCTESWTCISWSSCVNGQQTRTCTDANNCGTTSSKPTITQSCTVACTESWSCSSWSNCANGQQTRTCTDANNCGTTTSKPVITQNCTVACTESWTCTEWSLCTNDTQTRTCVDSKKCGTTNTKPVETKSCTLCGNGIIDVGETCSSCPLDISCGELKCLNGQCVECMTSSDCTGKERLTGEFVCSADNKGIHEKILETSGDCIDNKCSGSVEKLGPVKSCEGMFCQDGHCGCSEEYAGCEALGKCVKMDALDANDACSCDFQCKSGYCRDSKCMQGLIANFKSADTIIKPGEGTSVSFSISNPFNEEVFADVVVGIGSGSSISGVLGGEYCSGSQCKTTVKLPGNGQGDITIQLQGNDIGIINLQGVVTYTREGVKSEITKDLTVKVTKTGEEVVEEEVKPPTKSYLQYVVAGLVFIVLILLYLIVRAHPILPKKEENSNFQYGFSREALKKP